MKQTHKGDTDHIETKITPSRWRLLLLLPVVAFLIWLGRGALGILSHRDEAWTRIHREGVLRIGMDASYPPFEVVDAKGVFTGFDVDLATALAQRWDVTPRFINVHYDGLYDALDMEKFDLIISALPYDRTRTRDVLYSQSYFNAGQVLLAHRDSAASLDSILDLDGKRVAVELGAEAHQLARQLARDRGISLEIVPKREPDDAVALLLEGREYTAQGAVDALICDRIASYEYIHRFSALRLVGEPLTVEPYVIAARLDSPLLMREVDAALAAWHEDGLLDDLQRRWFQESH